MLARLILLEFCGPPLSFDSSSSLSHHRLAFFSRPLQVCCNVKSDQCKVQTNFGVGPNYFDLTGNRTRSDTTGAPSTIISDFTAQMEMEVDLATMKCTEFCPLQGATMSPYAVGPNATNIGTKQIGAHLCTGWQWKDTILGIVVMQINTIWVDQTTGLPVQEYDELTPFGQQIGFESTTYIQFTPKRPDAKLFAVVGQQSCPQSQNCGQQASAQRRAHRARYNKPMHWDMYATSSSAKEMLSFTQ